MVCVKNVQIIHKLHRMARNAPSFNAPQVPSSQLMVSVRNAHYIRVKIKMVKAVMMLFVNKMRLLLIQESVKNVPVIIHQIQMELNVSK